MFKKKKRLTLQGGLTTKEENKDVYMEISHHIRSDHFICETQLAIRGKVDSFF